MHILYKLKYNKSAKSNYPHQKSISYVYLWHCLQNWRTYGSDFNFRLTVEYTEILYCLYINIYKR